MLEGLLWYDDGEVTDAITRAVERFHRKYRRWPDLCYAHRDSVGERGITVRVGNCIIRVIPTTFTLKNHYQVGVANAPSEENRDRTDSSNTEDAMGKDL